MVQEKPVKSLGKWSREYFNDKQSVKEMLIQAETWMTSLKMNAYPVSIRPGDTNMGCFPDCSGHCLLTGYPSPLLRGLRGR